MRAVYSSLRGPRRLRLQPPLLQPLLEEPGNLRVPGRRGVLVPCIRSAKDTLACGSSRDTHEAKTSAYEIHPVVSTRKTFLSPMELLSQARRASKSEGQRAGEEREKRTGARRSLRSCLRSIGRCCRLRSASPTVMASFQSNTLREMSDGRTGVNTKRGCFG